MNACFMTGIDRNRANEYTYAHSLWKILKQTIYCCIPVGIWNCTLLEIGRSSKPKEGGKKGAKTQVVYLFITFIYVYITPY